MLVNDCDLFKMAKARDAFFHDGYESDYVVIEDTVLTHEEMSVKMNSTIRLFHVLDERERLPVCTKSYSEGCKSAFLVFVLCLYV